MKADEAPEKIYVVDATFPDYVDFDGSPINTKRIDDHDIEYTRTNAIKAKEVKLTWKDMRQIVAISDRMLIQKGNLDDKGFYEAVLEQFNKAQKGE